MIYVSQRAICTPHDRRVCSTGNACVGSIMRDILVFSMLILVGHDAVGATQDTDLLSSLLHHMAEIRDHTSGADNGVILRKNEARKCPYSLSEFNISVPENLLDSQFSADVSSVNHLVRLLNGLFSHRNPGSRDFSLAQWEALEPVARSAGLVLLESEQRLSGTHLCWFSGDADVLDVSQMRCRFFHFSSDVNDGGGAGRAAVSQPPHLLSIRDNQRSFLPILREVWPRLTQRNRTLDERAAWTAPYFDCNTSRWIITYVVGLSGRQDLHPDTSDHIVRGIFAVDIPLEKNVDVNQCADEEHPGSPFAHTNKCRHQTTTCYNVTGGGFRKGSYNCVCRPGYYLTGDRTYFSGYDVEEAYANKVTGHSDEYDTQFDCSSCALECATCVDGSPCVVTYDIVARGLPLGALTFCITCALFVGGAVYRYRKRKVIASATWPLLENIVIGAIMIYCSVIIRYFHPSFHLCLAEPWLRELGFVFFYCGVILKLYKVVTEFRTRKAHCVYVRDKDLVKYHVGIILITLGFMAAWTSVTMDLHRTGIELLLTVVNHQNMKYRICRMPWWDYVAEGLEMLILFWGIYLSYLARNSKTLYMERKLLTAAICVELIVSGFLYIIRHVIWYNVHPDVIYLLYFSRSQLTVTVNMLIIFGGKMWYIFRPQDDPFRKNQNQQHGQTGRPAELEKLNDGIFAGDLELNQIPLADMDHGEIRMELRRLYAQMQVLKTKAMRKDNPHISKKKGGRKMHAPHRRWADAQAEKACKKLRRHPKYDEETTAVKTPEESSASQENAPTIYEDEATYTSPLHAAFAGVAQNSAPLNRKAGLNMAMNYGHVTNL